MRTSEIVSKIENAELVFVSYTNILRDADKISFRNMLGRAGLRLWNGEITGEEYDGIFEELKRDAKGTVRGYAPVDNPRRIVTMPRRKVSA